MFPSGNTAEVAGIQRPMVNPARPWNRTTFQLISVIPASAGSIDKKFVEAYKCVIYWAKDRLPERRLSPSAWDGHSFRMEWPGQKVEVIAIPELGIWSFRLEQPDMPFGNRPAVAGRTWTTDITFTKHEQQIFVGVRAFCASLPYGDAEVALTRPRVVVELAQRLGLTDQRNLSREPWRLGTEADLNELKIFLTNPSRLLPVVVLTQPDKRRFDVVMSDFVLDPLEVAKRTVGLAHGVQLPWELGYKWTEMVGKPWSVYLGAVRTYMPGLDFENDAPAWHPSTFAEKVIFWKQPGDDRMGEGPFTDFLVERLHRHSATRRIDWKNLFFLSEARSKQAEAARSKATETSDWKQLYEDEIAALQAKIDELRKEAEEYSDDALCATQERDEYKDDNRLLRYQVDSLRQALSERTAGKSESEIPIPDNYDDLPDWVVNHLVGRLVLHSRAHRGLKDAAFEEVPLVYRGLLMLANEYRNQCLSRDGAKEAFAKKLAELGFHFDKSISKERAGEQGDDYFVRYPTGSSPKRFLEWHLTKGNAKDARHCLRIYFFWHDETEQVVVGWLPSHLENRMT